MTSQPIADDTLRRLEKDGLLPSIRLLEDVLHTVEGEQIHWDHMGVYRDLRYHRALQDMPVFDPERYVHVRRQIAERFGKSTIPRRYVSRHYVSSSRPLLFREWDPAIIKETYNVEISRIITAAYLPTDVPYVLQLGGYHHLLDESNSVLSEILKQSKALPTTELPKYRYDDIQTFSDMFTSGDCFSMDATLYKRHRLLYPYFDDQFGYDISIRPAENYEGYIYVEYADIYAGSSLYDRHQDAVKDELADKRLVGVTGDSNLIMLSSLNLHEGFRNPHRFSTSVAPRMFRAFDDKGHDLLRHFNSLNMELFSDHCTLDRPGQL